MKGDRKFNFDSVRDVISGGGEEENHNFQPFFSVTQMCPEN